MTSTFTIKASSAAVGAVLLTAIAAGPALADEYPPQNTNTTTQSTTGVASTGTTDSGSLAYTGSGFTTIGLLTGIAVLGAGTGLVIASRRRTN